MIERAITHRFFTLATLVAFGCGGGLPTSTRPGLSATSAVPSGAAPSAIAARPLPPPGERAPLPFLELGTLEVSSGVHVVTVVRPSQPLVDVRLVASSGSASDGERVGRAAVTARLIAEAARPPRMTVDPRELVLSVETDVDHVVLGASVLPDAVESSLVALGAALAMPKFSPPDAKRAARALGVDESAWLRSLNGAGERLIRRDLFVEPVGRHPYASVHPTAEDLAKIDAASVNDCARSSYVAENLTLIVVGPIAGIDVGEIAERAFAHVPTQRPAPPSIDAPMTRPRPLRIALVDDPKRSSVSISVGRLGPELGEGESIASRLFGRVVIGRMKRGGEAPATFRLVPFREGPSIAIFEAEVPVKSARATLAALLAPDTSTEVSEAELSRARDGLDDELALALDRPGFLADALSGFAALSLPPSTLERDSIEARTTARDRVSSVGRHMLEGDEVAVVVGDAKALVAELRTLGDVDILDPSRDFERLRTERRQNDAKLPSEAKKGDDSKQKERTSP